MLRTILLLNIVVCGFPISHTVMHLCVCDINKISVAISGTPGELKCQDLMRVALMQLNLSERGYNRVMKLACTIANLAVVRISSLRI